MENVVPFPTPNTSYVKVLDWDALKKATSRFRTLHPDLLPIVVYRVLADTWVGPLTDQQLRQALRDCFDMTERAAVSGQGLYSPMNFVRQRLVLCLENQALGLDDPSVDATLERAEMLGLMTDASPASHEGEPLPLLPLGIHHQ
jgi:hypothetical protein